MSNVKIQGIEIFHPEKKLDNKYYIDHFAKRGKNIEHMLEAYGRKERYVIDDEKETIITMATKAGEKVLKSCNLTGDDIDLFIFTTQTPEYIWPSNSIVIFGNLNINPRAQIFDLNANCVGMLAALVNVNSAMKGDPKIKRALIIGTDNFSTVNNPDNEYLYPMFGDLACAVVLEKTENENEGILDTEFLSEGSDPLSAGRYPNNGFKELFMNEDKKMFTWWDPTDTSFMISSASIAVNDISERTGITVNDIDHFCYSQYAKSLTKGIAESLNADLDKFIYVADKYGYTGTTSPFLALYEGVKTGKIKRGDIVSMWSVGIRWVTCTLLIRF